MLELLMSHKEDIALIGTSLVAIMSALANIVPKDSLAGKVIHFLALNLKVK
jgi:hypothetical protein